MVIFTRDLVLRASLIDQFYTQRLIETALTSGGGTQFRFAAVPGGTGALGPASGAGFGCGDPDTLTVQRKSENEITFPGCGDFPNPLVTLPEPLTFRGGNTSHEPDGRPTVGGKPPGP